jgi:hypothetical protein
VGTHGLLSDGAPSKHDGGRSRSRSHQENCLEKNFVAGGVNDTTDSVTTEVTGQISDTAICWSSSLIRHAEKAWTAKGI